MVLMVFALSIGNYPQEAIVQFPLSIYFYLMLAIITVTKLLDNQTKGEEKETPAPAKKIDARVY